MSAKKHAERPPHLIVKTAELSGYIASKPSEPSVVATAAIRESAAMLANAWSHLEYTILSRGLDINDFIEWAYLQGLFDFKWARVSLYNPNESNREYTAPLAVLCMIAKYVGTDVVTLINTTKKPFVR